LTSTKSETTALPLTATRLLLLLLLLLLLFKQQSLTDGTMWLYDITALV
jgi:hypothetical protein